MELSEVSLNISFLLTQGLRSPSAAGRFFPLAKSLAHLGHEVTMLALHHDYAHCEQRRFVQDGVEVRYVGQMHIRKLDGRKIDYGPLSLLMVTAISTVRLTWAALHTDSDVVHVCKTQPMNGLAAWVVHKLRRIPVFLDSDDYEAAHNRFSGRWQQGIVAWFENWMPSFAEGITANSSFIADRFKRLGYPAEHIRLVPNGVDRDRFAVLERPDLPELLADLRRSLGVEEQDRVILYVGAMRTISHAVDLLLDAFVEIARVQSDAVLLLVGDGVDLGKLQHKAVDLGISERVVFLGHVSAEEIPLYYRLSDVTVDPRRDSLAARSSLSLKLVESIVAGVPCVTTDVGDRREIVGSAGLAVAPGDVQALTAGILHVLESPDVHSEMQLAAESLSRKYYWDVLVRDFVRVYDTISGTESAG